MLEVVLAREFTEHARGKLAQDLSQIRRCATLLSADEFWRRANEHTNSAGNLVLHLEGNVRQWVLSGLGGAPDHRDRPAEFAAPGPRHSGEDVLARLEQTVTRALEIIGRLEPRDLAARRTIQGYDVSGLTAVFHVVEHFSGHTAQIVHITKVLRNVDLSLYDEQGRKRQGQTATP